MSDKLRISSMKRALYAITCLGLALSSQASAAQSAAKEDAWTKVRELKTGTELRIFKKGAKQPVLAEMDEANDERMVVILKNEQVAIPKGDVDRLDFRPKGGSRVTKQSSVKTTVHGNPSPSDQRIGGGTPGPTTSSSTSLSIGSKPEFETIYRRLPAAPRPLE